MATFSTGGFKSNAATAANNYTTTIIINKNPVPRLRIALPVGKIRLPVTPPSPIFMGVIEDINTEDFPEFKEVVDLDIVEQAEPPHCTKHCKHYICQAMAAREAEGLDKKPLPVCQCVEEDIANRKKTSKPSRPKLQFNDEIIEEAYEIRKNADDNEIIDIYSQDVSILLNGLKRIEDARAMEWLAPRLRERFPTQAEAAATGLADSL